mmetsp:Transcript_9531/g.19503  ORF Transcript_9531/g.19503 Transcript_9531/m.19503 type:complete len:95 (+) Transcript_9531:3004-3288(+)
MENSSGERERERARVSERDRERARVSERDRDRERESEREMERQTERRKRIVQYPCLITFGLCTPPGTHPRRAPQRIYRPIESILARISFPSWAT